MSLKEIEEKFVLLEESNKEKIKKIEEIIIRLDNIVAKIQEKQELIMAERINELLVEEPARKGEVGKIRVGRIADRFAKGVKYPVTDGYINVVVASINKTKIGSELSPFTLRSKYLMENIWQFSKVYSSVLQYTSKNWSWGSEKHCLHDVFSTHLGENDKISPKYWKWRQAGMSNSLPVRSPVERQDRGRCLYSYWPTHTLGKNMSLENIDQTYKKMPKAKMSCLDYIEARINIYCPLYTLLAKETNDFKCLAKLLNDGYNLQLIEYDGPLWNDQIEPYCNMTQGNYGESEVGSIEISKKVIKSLLRDVSQPFGHAYVLAAALLGKEKWLYTL
jgi:hypothetical protein